MLVVADGSGSLNCKEYINLDCDAFKSWWAPERDQLGGRIHPIMATIQEAIKQAIKH